MARTKSPFSSMTIQGLVVVLIGMGLSMFGVLEVSDKEVISFTAKVFEVIPQIIELVGLVIATIGRFRATDKLQLKKS